MLLLHLGMCRSVPFQVGEMHIKLEEIGEFIFPRRDEGILMKLLRPRHGRLWLHDAFWVGGKKRKSASKEGKVIGGGRGIEPINEGCYRNGIFDATIQPSRAKSNMA